jgi:hypothetical protein
MLEILDSQDNEHLNEGAQRYDTVQLVLVLKSPLQLSACDSYTLKLVATSCLSVYYLMLAGRKHEVSVDARQMSVVRRNTAFQCGDNIAFSAGIVLELRYKDTSQKFKSFLML